jgi:NAD-dependent dihydropyrimidine dehydrogenase PreA subunit
MGDIEALFAQESKCQTKQHLNERKLSNNTEAASNSSLIKQKMLKKMTKSTNLGIKIRLLELGQFKIVLRLSNMSLQTIMVWKQFMKCYIYTLRITQTEEEKGSNIEEGIQTFGTLVGKLVLRSEAADLLRISGKCQCDNTCSRCAAYLSIDVDYNKKEARFRQQQEERRTFRNERKISLSSLQTNPIIQQAKNLKSIIPSATEDQILSDAVKALYTTIYHYDSDSDDDDNVVNDHDVIKGDIVDVDHSVEEKRTRAHVDEITKMDVISKHFTNKHRRIRLHDVTHFDIRPDPNNPSIVPLTRHKLHGNPISVLGPGHRLKASFLVQKGRPIDRGHDAANWESTTRISIVDTTRVKINVKTEESVPETVRQEIADTCPMKVFNMIVHPTTKYKHLRVQNEERCTQCGNCLSIVNIMKRKTPEVEELRKTFITVERLRRGESSTHLNISSDETPTAPMTSTTKTMTTTTMMPKQPSILTDDEIGQSPYITITDDTSIRTMTIGCNGSLPPVSVVMFGLDELEDTLSDLISAMSDIVKSDEHRLQVDGLSAMISEISLLPGSSGDTRVSTSTKSSKLFEHHDEEEERHEKAIMLKKSLDLLATLSM